MLSWTSSLELREKDTALRSSLTLEELRIGFVLL